MAKAKTRLSPEQAVQRLSLLLCEDPSMNVVVEEVYRRYADDEERLARLRELAHRRGKLIPAWV